MSGKGNPKPVKQEGGESDSPPAALSLTGASHSSGSGPSSASAGGGSKSGPSSTTVGDSHKKDPKPKPDIDAGNEDEELSSEGDPKEEDDERAGLVKALRRMGIRAPKPFDLKRDRKFETWLDRTEYHLMVTKCPEEDRTACLLLLLDAECYEQAKHLGITGAMDFDDAKTKLRDYFAITETAEELREKLDLRKQEPGESIEAFARDVKLIGHRAYPNGDPALLEHILIKQFTSGLRDEKSRERVILKIPKTLTEAASFARFAEAAVRVAKNRSVTPAPVGSVAHGSRSSGYSGGGQNRNRSAPPDRGRSRSNSFRGRNTNFRKSDNNPARSGSSNSQSSDQRRFDSREAGDRSTRRVECYNCHKLGHIARECRAPRRTAPPTAPGSWRRPATQRVGAVGSQSVSARSQAPLFEEEPEQAEASGYTANGINCVPGKQNSSGKSILHSSRQLLWVPGKLNNVQFDRLLVDSGSPVTILRRDLWVEVSGDSELLHSEEEVFQGVTEHGLEVLGRTHIRMRFGGLDVVHPVVVVDNIAHKFIIGNDFLLQFKCDILYSQDAILFGGKLVQFKLFRSTVNLISPVICQSTTEIGPFEEAAIPCLLDSWKRYDPRVPLLLEPRQDALMGSILGARVLVSSVSPSVTVLVSNLSKERVIIPKSKVLADEYEVHIGDSTTLTGRSSSCVSSVSNTVGEPKNMSPIEEAMSNADKALSVATASIS